MFERFTARARQVVVHAQEEARALGHHYIGTEHILLGLLREEEGVATRALASLGIELDQVRAKIEQIIGRGTEAAAGQIPFTPRAKRALELSLREAIALGHNYIGAEHILLGVARENDGVAARILLELDADAERIRSEVYRLAPPLATLESPRRSLRRRGRTAVTVSRPPCWEYRVERRPALDDDAVAWLNELGADGWELAGVVASDGVTLLFKRLLAPGDVQLRAAGA
jgi:ATP-dependent Clp protease ATP-binding subunit ClpC